MLGQARHRRSQREAIQARGLTLERARGQEATTEQGRNKHICCGGRRQRTNTH